MIFRLTMKTPDALEDAIKEKAFNLFAEDAPTTEEEEIKIDEAVDQATKVCQKWFKYGELVTLEIDTDNKTCKVVEV